MVDEMLVAQSSWLPQYESEIEKAKTRLKTLTVNKKNWDGAARMKVRSTQELQNSENATLLVEDQAFNN